MEPYFFYFTTTSYSKILDIISNFLKSLLSHLVLKSQCSTKIDVPFRTKFLTYKLIKCIYQDFYTLYFISFTINILFINIFWFSLYSSVRLSLTRDLNFHLSGSDLKLPEWPVSKYISKSIMTSLHPAQMFIFCIRFLW